MENLPEENHWAAVEMAAGHTTMGVAQLKQKEKAP
jgi:hypothetical protein